MKALSDQMMCIENTLWIKVNKSFIMKPEYRRIFEGISIIKDIVYNIQDEMELATDPTSSI